jgi:hypothetical protein
MMKYQYAILCLVELLVKGRIAQFTTPSFICSFHGLGAVALFGSELVLNVGILWVFDTTAYRISGSIARFVPAQDNMNTEKHVHTYLHCNLNLRHRCSKDPRTTRYCD